MASFSEALGKTLNTEGGYVHDPDDPGGETYKGIARSRNSKWAGWSRVDMNKNNPDFPNNLEQDAVLQESVKSRYLARYWNKVRGDKIKDQDIAESIFDFAVNAGPRTSARLAQRVIGATPDGVIGPKTLERLNQEDPRTFLAVFALAKICRYVDICEKRRVSHKYFFGWVRRTLKGFCLDCFELNRP